MKAGSKLLVLYCVITYVIPAILVALYGQPGIYRPVSMSPGVLLVIFTVLLAILWTETTAAADNASYHLRPLSQNLQVAMMSVSLLIAAAGYFSGVNSFRYSDVSIGEEGTFLKIGFSFSATLNILILPYLIFCEKEALFPGETAKKRKLIRILLLLSSFFSVNGIAGALVALVVFFVVFFPKVVRAFVIKDSGVSMAYRVGMILLVGLSVIMMPFLILLGLSIKQKVNVSELSFKDDVSEIYLIGEYFVSRISAHYYSLMLACQEYAFNFSGRSFQNLLEPVKSVVYRSDVLMGHPFGVEKRLLGSISRVNVELISNYSIGDREGTAPGLLGGFILCFPFPLNFVSLFLFLVWITTLFNRLVLAFGVRVSFFGFLIINYFMYSDLVNSPIDWLLIFDETFIFLLALLSFIATHMVRVSPAER